MTSEVFQAREHQTHQTPYCTLVKITADTAATITSGMQEKSSETVSVNIVSTNIASTNILCVNIVSTNMASTNILCVNIVPTNILCVNRVSH